MPERRSVRRRAARRVVTDVRTHAALARELSIGLYEAFNVLARRPVAFDGIFARHDRGVRADLPGF